MAIILSIATAIFYGYFSWEHKGEPYSVRAKNALGGALMGFGVEALFWFAVIVTISQLVRSNDTMWQVLVLVMETPMLPISLVNISTFMIPLAFAVYKDSEERYDYRGWAIFIVCALALIFGIYY